MQYSSAYFTLKCNLKSIALLTIYIRFFTSS